MSAMSRCAARHAKTDKCARKRNKRSARASADKREVIGEVTPFKRSKRVRAARNAPTARYARAHYLRAKMRTSPIAGVPG